MGQWKTMWVSSSRAREAHCRQMRSWLRWVMQAARLWNRALAAEQGSLLRQTVTTSAALALAPGSRQPAHQPWRSSWQHHWRLSACSLTWQPHGPLAEQRCARRTGSGSWTCCRRQHPARRHPAAALCVCVHGGTLDAASLATPADSSHTCASGAAVRHLRSGAPAPPGVPKNLAAGRECHASNGYAHTAVLAVRLLST